MQKHALSLVNCTLKVIFHFHYGYDIGMLGVGIFLVTTLPELCTFYTPVVTATSMILAAIKSGMVSF